MLSWEPLSQKAALALPHNRSSISPAGTKWIAQLPPVFDENKCWNLAQLSWKLLLVHYTSSNARESQASPGCHLRIDSNPTYHIWTQNVTQHNTTYWAAWCNTWCNSLCASIRRGRQHLPGLPNWLEVGKSCLNDFLPLSTVLNVLRISKDSAISKDLLLLALAALAKRGSLGPAKPSSFAASQFSTLFRGKKSASGDTNCGMPLEWYWWGLWNRDSNGCLFHWELSPVLAQKYTNNESCLHGVFFLNRSGSTRSVQSVR